ncbi:putative F-box/kelch-repeat protein [Raphanus sativus]|nr:putative F-box/kelch-repeat protein [Raphanus sativus]
MVIPSLPWELECEILSRVPPTSVKRLQLTCKRWYALFKDQRFINNHLRKSETQMVLLNDESVYSFSFNFHGINNWYGRFIDCTGKLKSLKYSEKVKISEIFHCEGLLLCTTTDNSLVVWNPCTGQTRWIQSRQSSNRYTKYKYFLGYENENKSRDSLKILELSYNLGVWKFEIYEFNSDSWRVLDTDSVNFGILSSLGVSLKGNTYWLVYDLVSFILRFDFTTESFGHLSLPRQSDDDYDAGVVLSVVREEKLALLFQNSARSSQVKIW